MILGDRTGINRSETGKDGKDSSQDKANKRLLHLEGSASRYRCRELDVSFTDCS